MGRKPAIARAMKRKRGTGADPTASAAGKAKPLTRKDREYMNEFGVLDLNDIKDEEPGEALMTKIVSKRAFTEEEIDQAERKRARIGELERDRQRRLAAAGEGEAMVTENADDILSDDDGAKPKGIDVLKQKLLAGKRKRDLLAAFRTQISPAALTPVSDQLSLSDVEDEGEPSLSDDEDSDGEAVLDDDDEEDDGEGAGASKSSYPNFYDVHFADQPDHVGRVRTLAKSLQSGSLKWTTANLTDTTSYQFVAPPAQAAAAQQALQADLAQTVDVNAMNIKLRILTQFLATHPTQSTLFHDLFGKMDQYHDILYTSADYLRQATRLRRMYVLHALNHVFKYRDRVLRGNAKVRAAQGGGPVVNLAKIDISDEAQVAKLTAAAAGGPRATASAPAPLTQQDVDVRDQGFTRPKVLILAPFRSVAYEIVSLLVELSGTEQQENKKRFKDEYYEADDPNDEGWARRSAEYRAQFRGNTDDCFRLGLKFTRKSMKIYSQFYNSDIIVASPLGLRMHMESEKDIDFLSSIETVLVDGAHVMNMQNWEHLCYVMERLNKIPKQSHDCDFSRIKSWYLDELAKHFRQTVILSEYMFPELSSLYNSCALNVTRARLRYRMPTATGSIVHVTAPAPQRFVKLDAPLAQIDEERFRYLTTEILPQFRRPRGRAAASVTVDVDTKHLLVFIPSYFDFVKVRNHMDEAEYDFETLCEYTSASDKLRARTLFVQGRTRILLYTERMHFFQRLAIKGALHVVFFAPPDNAAFYADVVNFLSLPRPKALSAAANAAGAGVADGDVTVLYSKWDALRLERIVGADRVGKMLTGAGPFLFRT
ncbi:hypothetical protein AMAG_00361 [Allomyces macrogynus ATCC 38327]|uniref:U3 small nucleolar RNA-associated protein 25 n=1 Tax=Allomyces macrogynus (strain ATCC 38327) TaxID=578462 RepID=A0A0L0RWD2_ALLM3|nr:hypothetical protein AMAG_00361 [Allomyces macrogynus ATCC 38327]|eukprot:KNE54386.1 hypothetical protein AMAG_00361 [Allomyces macrogynus ATCC 38327]